MLCGCATQAQIDFANMNRATDQIAARYPDACKALKTVERTEQNRAAFDHCEQISKELTNAMGKERDAFCSKLFTENYKRPSASFAKQELNAISFCGEHRDSNHDLDPVFHDAYHQ